MAKHAKARAFEMKCKHCGVVFITGSSIKFHCSPECRVRDVAATFADIDGCWEWPGTRNPQTGYGQLSSWEDGKLKLYTAHRMAFRALVGAIAPGQHVLHRCDNRPCFNPAHLFLGTQLDNMIDMESKGRRRAAKGLVPWSKQHPELMPRGAAHHLTRDSSCLPRGVAHHNAALTAEDVIAIRQSKETLAVLAERYGVSQSNLSSVRRRKTWKHVLNPLGDVLC